jgi:hypothetical protein
MFALVIIISVFLLIALLRLGVIAEYDDSGLKLWFKAGFLRFRWLVDDDGKSVIKLKQLKNESAKIKPGSLDDFLDLFKNIKNVLNRLKRKLFIKRLKLYYTSACDNAADTAIQFGVANAVLGLIIPIFESNFKIKHRDIKVFADFNSSKHRIYAKIIISIAIWEVIYILLAILPIFTSKNKNKQDLSKKMTERMMSNGKSTG